MRDVRVVADKLTVDHLRVLPDGELVGTEIALLDQLAEAVGSSTGRGSARGTTASRSPVNLGALNLERKIRHHVNAGLQELGLAGEAWPTLSNRARFFLYSLPQETYDGNEGIWLGWERAIRTLLDPPVQVALRGVACANCRYAQVLLPDPLEPGAELLAPAVLVTISARPTAKCRVCGEQYDTRTLHSLGDVQDLTSRG